MKKGDLSDSKCGNVVVARVTGSSIFKKVLQVFLIQTSLWFIENGLKERKYPKSSSSLGELYARGQRRMARLLQADRKATLTQIITR